METLAVDVIIVGAGLSGISMAALMGRKLPSKRYVVLEARDEVGGTWDLFRYPGIRSDSDMHTLGFSFHPWKDRDAIAAGGKIKRYIAETIDRFGVRPSLRMGHRLIGANFDSGTGRWTAEVERKDGTKVRYESQYLYMGSGYYDYNAGYTPEFAGRDDFAGQVVHPQFWPEDLDYAGKRVVVVGSGATAVTLIPALADQTAHITMIQRSPTFVMARPAKDRIANHFKTWLPAGLAYMASRWKNIAVGRLMRRRFMKDPLAVKPMMIDAMKQQLPEGFDMAHFTPRHQPWEQRICLSPDGDFFQAIRDGRASVTTGKIDRFVPEGVRMESGEVIPADIIVTATGLNLTRGGTSDVSVDGTPVNFADTVIYKGAMYSNVPNYSLVFGYTGASWTLKADLTARWFIRLIREADRKGADIVVPAADILAMDLAPMHTFTSGYIRRSLANMPKQGKAAPWQVHQDYLTDRKIMLKGAMEDGTLVFAKAGEEWRVKPQDAPEELAIAAE